MNEEAETKDKPVVADSKKPPAAAAVASPAKKPALGGKKASSAAADDDDEATLQLERIAQQVAEQPRAPVAQWVVLSAHSMQPRF